ncbi:ketol-acid reductoisomerase [Candidatus Gottesmanbacteria bacterium RIFCSPHIGHO2_12_FULL_40_13]|nr:MAG: ketol-acid reductoisomerase [Candidatus Gottesmanbacteria bacterium RIFCSPHIGHO2_12_FULL_40_13]
MSRIKFGKVFENVITRTEFPLKKARNILKNETVAVIGYGVQGPAQALNLRDNGINVIIGQRRPSPSYTKAISDGWVAGKNLFSISQAADKGTLIAYLLSDAGQVAVWPQIKKYLTRGKTLYFSHGFAVSYSRLTKVIIPGNIDVILVAPKGAGRSVRKNFLEGRGINSSFAVFQNASGKAKEKALAMGIAIGSGFLFETTFEKEVYSDLTGERGVLMGAIAGIMEAQYQELRRHGHTPSEAFNETVEELTQSLIPLVAENGMDWMYMNCSTTAQIGALVWKDKFRKAVVPVFKILYDRVKKGEEVKKVLIANSRKDYRKNLARQLKKIGQSEMWQAGKTVRSLRPENWKKSEK